MTSRIDRRSLLGGLTLGALLPGQALAVKSGPATALRDACQAMIDAGELPNAQVAIEQHGRTLAAFSLGYRDVAAGAPLPGDAVFRLYSMSKPITSVAAMMLVEQGRIALDDSIDKYLPKFAGVRVYAGGTLEAMVTVPPVRPVTVRDLLTHSSGLTYQFMGDTPVHRYYRRFGAMRDTAVGPKGDTAPATTLDQLVARLGKAPLLHQPGERFSYGYSTTMLGAVIERASEMKLDAFLASRIFDPLGMKDIRFVVTDAQLPRFVTLYRATAGGMEPVETAEASEYRSPDRLLDGGGALVGTLADYLAFARMLANGGRPLLRPETLATMFEPRLRTGGTGLEDTAFGYGFAVGDAKSEAMGGLPAGAVSWAGSGNTYFFVQPRRRLIAILMTNELMSGERTERVRRLLNRAALELAG